MTSKLLSSKRKLLPQQMPFTSMFHQSPNIYDSLRVLVPRKELRPIYPIPKIQSVPLFERNANDPSIGGMRTRPLLSGWWLLSKYQFGVGPCTLHQPTAINQLAATTILGSSPSLTGQLMRWKSYFHGPTAVMFPRSKINDPSGGEYRWNFCDSIGDQIDPIESALWFLRSWGSSDREIDGALGVVGHQISCAWIIYLEKGCGTVWTI